MNILKDQDVEIDGYVLGLDHDLFVTELDSSGPDWRDQDGLNPSGDTRWFGRDYLTPPTWLLSVISNTDYDPGRALAALGQLQRIARNTDVRLNPGAESVLRYNIAGRTRRVYGRLRKPQRKPGPVGNGVASAIAQFDTSDTLYYDDVERAVQVKLVPDPTGGFTLPTTVPIVMGKIADVQGTIDDVGGDEPTPFRAVIEGPVLNYGLSGNGWEVKLNDSIAEGDSVTIDTRLGTVIDNHGVSRAGSLTRFSWLSEARLQPGPDHVIFSGLDPTGQATATVYWHPAYSEF